MSLDDFEDLSGFSVVLKAKGKNEIDKETAKAEVARYINRSGKMNRTLNKSDVRIVEKIPTGSGIIAFLLDSNKIPQLHSINV